MSLYVPILVLGRTCRAVRRVLAGRGLGGRPEAVEPGQA